MIRTVKKDNLFFNGDATSCESSDLGIYPIVTYNSFQSTSSQQIPNCQVVHELGTFLNGTNSFTSKIDFVTVDMMDDNFQMATYTNNLFVGEAEVSNSQYLAVMGEDPPFSSEGVNSPARGISWEKAMAFTNELTMLVFDDLSMTCSNYLTCNAQIQSNCDVKPIYAENNIYHCPGFRLPTHS